MIEWIKDNLLLIITTIGGPVATFYFSRRHYQEKELKSQDLKNDGMTATILEGNLKIYQTLVDDLKIRIDHFIKLLSEKEQEIQKLHMELNSLRDRIRELERHYNGNED